MEHLSRVSTMVAIGFLIGACTGGPGVTVPMGYNETVDYPNTFRVEASKTGPPNQQSYIAGALEEVLSSKGLTSSTVPGVVFSLEWFAEDVVCDSMKVDGEVCVNASPMDQPLFVGHLNLRAHEAVQGRQIWEAQFVGFRRMPIESPTEAEIRELFIPAFTEALAGYPNQTR